MKKHLLSPRQLINEMIMFTPKQKKKKQVQVTRLIRKRKHFSRGFIVSVGVSRMEKSRVVFAEPGAKVNSECYCDRILRHGLLPDIRARCNRNNWALQQDGASSHTARNTLNFLQQENVNFIEPDICPPNSPDLNPVNYAIWVAQKTHRLLSS